VPDPGFISVAEIANLLPARYVIQCHRDAEIKQLLKSGADQATDNERIELLTDGRERAFTSRGICK
jgi:hypothetical protein